MKKNSKNVPGKKYPITTVTQCRVPIFWPTNKPPRSKETLDLIIKNDWGSATIKDCRLTQVHRNILDVIFAYHHGLYEYEDGSIGFLVDLYELQKILQMEATNHTWILKKFKDMMKTIFVAETNDWVITGVILRKHSYSKRDADHTEEKFGNNKLYYVVFEAEFMKFFDLDTHVSYFKLVDKIIAIENPMCQALIRFCLSHHKVNADLEKTLTKIGILRAGMHRRQKSKIMKQIFLSSDVLKEQFGIAIEPMKNKRLGIFYTKHKEVFFDLPNGDDTKPNKDGDSR